MKNLKRALSLFTAAAAASMQLPVQPASAASAMNPETGLPYAFDLRELGLVSAVKDQGSYGTCWAHAAMSMLEGTAIADDPTIDLSEWHLANYIYLGEPGLTEIDDEQRLAMGNLPENTSALLLNRVGPMDEADFPYGSGTPDRSTPITEMQQNARLEVTAAHRYIAWNDNKFTEEPLGIKKLLCSGISPTIALSVSYLSTSCYNPYYSSLYYPADRADELSGELTAEQARTGHAMTLVGWDDNYPAENFNYPPARDGAWLVKNSWGTNWGDAGYLWISYADTNAAEFSWYDARPASDHDQYFSYDNCGDTGVLSFSLDESDTEAFYANVFTAESDCCLTDVMLCSTDPEDTLEVTIYTNLTNPKNPVSGEASPVFVYQGLPQGYSEVALSSGVSVKAGEPFAVTVKASGKAGSHIPCELGMEDYQLVKNRTGYYYGSFNSVALSTQQMEKYYDRGQSYISTDGKAWTDTADVHRITNIGRYALVMGNVSVRAYGVDAGTVKFSAPSGEAAIGEEITLTSAEGADIYYKINGGSFVKYKSPITFTEEMALTAYADTGSKTAKTVHYRQKRAALSSLLLYGESGKEYADLSEGVYTLNARDDAFIQPISVGEITVNGEAFTSGQKYMIRQKDSQTGIVIRVEQDGMLPAEYRINVKDMTSRPIPNGIYYVPGEGIAVEFRNGTATEKHPDGTEKVFTYEQTRRGIWEFRYDDGTVTYQADMWFISDGGFLHGYMNMIGDAQTVYYEYLNPLSFAAYPAYTDAQLSNYTLKSFKNFSGKDADSVELTETNDVIILDFYNGKNLVETLFCDRFGLMFTGDMKLWYYSLPQYRRADLNGDKAVNIADAVMMQRILTEQAPDKAPSASALAAADLSCDGVLTVYDTMLLMDMLNRATNHRA